MLSEPMVFRKGFEAALDRLERNEALPAEDIARPHRELGVVHADVVVMAVHPVEPSRHPAAARFEKRDLHLREAITHTAHDETCRRRHHLERMRDHMAHRESLRETIHRERRLRAFRTAMDTDRDAK